MNELPDEMLPNEVDIEQWYPKPQPSPFSQNSYGPKTRIGRSNWIAEEVNSISPETSPPLQDVFHPFKIISADGFVYVFPGYVYGNVGSKQFKQVIPTLSGTALGNPLYGETFPSIALSEQYLWIKITIANSTVYTAEIVYSSEASALDSDTVRYILIGKTFTDGTIEQRLKENAFVNIKAADWAEVTFNSITSATTGTVNISAGCVMRTETGAPSGTAPEPTKILTRLKDGGGTFLPNLESAVSVTHGDKVYMVLTYTQSSYGTDGTVFYDCTDSEYIIDTSPSDSDTSSYIHIADIMIVDSVMTIKPKFPGVVTAPTLVLPKDSTASTTNVPYWTTEYVDSNSALVKRGALISFSYYLSNPTESQVNQTLQLDWGTTGVAGVAEDIPVDGLADGNYLWVEIPLLQTDTSFTSTDTYAGGDLHNHQVYSSFNETQGGASIPFINFGDSSAMTSMTTGVVKIPFARFIDGGITQLHVGVMMCPAFFSLAAP